MFLVVLAVGWERLLKLRERGISERMRRIHEVIVATARRYYETSLSWESHLVLIHPFGVQIMIVGRL